MDGRTAMKPPAKPPDPFKEGPSRDRVIIRGMEFQWDERNGTIEIQGLPAILMWVDSTLVGLMSGLATMVGPERFSLALQSEGRKSVESDWQFLSTYPDFRSGFAALAVVAAVAGWGDWQLVSEDEERRECRFRAFNTWEGLYQRRLGACWGSSMLAGKLAGYCSKRFGTNCWAVQTAFLARGDACDEFTVGPSSRNVEEEVARLLDTDPGDPGPTWPLHSPVCVECRRD
jgi:rsbT co-antagonist protein RsbR